MQWKPVLHNFSAKKHERLKTEAPNGLQCRELLRKKNPGNERALKGCGGLALIVSAPNLGLNRDFGQDVHAANLGRQPEFASSILDSNNGRLTAHPVLLARSELGRKD